MDDLDYYYYTSSGGTYTMTATGGAPTNATNKLAYVDDAGTAGNYADDLEDQSAGNYTYDEIGNLIDDNQEEIDVIEWNVYGKIQMITRDASSKKSDLIFIYDSFGQRIGKIVKPRTGSGYKDQDEWTYTYYVRDASGNVMATYTRSYIEGDEGLEDKLKLSETHLYGSSRLGIKDRADENIYSSVLKTFSGITNGEYVISGITDYVAMNAADLATPERTLGYKQYEFTNHLGNVLVTLSDRKTQVQSGASVSYFMSDVRSYSDYSAFGVALEGRHGGTYRYGMNGKESDNETSTYDYGFRIYNARLGRFLSVDPLTRNYPEITPYQFASNTPIQAIDLDGLEACKTTIKTGSAAKRAAAQGTNVVSKPVSQPKVAPVPAAITNRNINTAPVATAQNKSSQSQVNKPNDAPPQATTFVSNHNATTAQTSDTQGATGACGPNGTADIQNVGTAPSGIGDYRKNDGTHGGQFKEVPNPDYDPNSDSEPILASAVVMGGYAAAPEIEVPPAAVVVFVAVTVGAVIYKCATYDPPTIYVPVDHGTAAPWGPPPTAPTYTATTTTPGPPPLPPRGGRGDGWGGGGGGLAKVIVGTAATAVLIKKCSDANKNPPNSTSMDPTPRDQTTGPVGPAGPDQ